MNQTKFNELRTGVCSHLLGIAEKCMSVTYEDFCAMCHKYKREDDPESVAIIDLFYINENHANYVVNLYNRES